MGLEELTDFIKIQEMVMHKKAALPEASSLTFMG
jgi:hypothetical protein